MRHIYEFSTYLQSNQYFPIVLYHMYKICHNIPLTSPKRIRTSLSSIEYTIDQIHTISSLFLKQIVCRKLCKCKSTYDGINISDNYLYTIRFTFYEYGSNSPFFAIYCFYY